VTPCPTHDIRLDRFEKIWIALLKNIPHSLGHSIKRYLTEKETS
jgi:hypothetical protein